MTLRTATATLALVFLLPLTGCDETGADTTDEALVIADAQAAREARNYPAAKALLEKALDRNPTSAPVRAELATTVLASRNLNLLDLDRIAQFIANGVGGLNAATEAPAAGRGMACRYATQDGARAFDPTEIADFPDVAASRAAIDSVMALVTPILPASLRSFDTCTTIGADGRLVYDRAAATAELRSKGLSDAQIGQLLAANALARFFDAYLYVTTDVPQQTTWYRLADGSIGVCAEDESKLREQTEDSIETLGTAVLSLDVRTQSFGGSSELIDLALDALADIRSAFGDVCGG